ncbi:MAG: hypothetical protein FJZ89_04005 [Chloroflexi bacterium]|nr:hypothetical protein [Chloroflexota bacterium]
MRRLLAALGIALLCLMLTAPAAWAGEFKGGSSVTVGRDQVINDDFYAAGGTITIDGTINGDVIATGGTMVINGNVNGNVIAAGGQLTIAGKVAQSVRMAGGVLAVNGQVGRDVVLAGANATIGSQAVIGGDVVLGAGTANVGGSIGKRFLGGGGDVTFDAVTKGNVEVSAENLTIAPAAKIGGNLIYTTARELPATVKSQVTGDMIHRLPEVQAGERGRLVVRGPSLFDVFVGKLLGWLRAFLLGAALLLLWPKRTSAVTAMLQARPWWSLGWGVLLLLLTPLAILIVCLTVIGLPIGLIGLALYLAMLYASQIFVGLWLGRWVLAWLQRTAKWTQVPGFDFWALAIGLAIIWIVRALPIPLWSVLLGLAIIFFGLGALWLTWQRIYSESRRAGTA